MSHLAGPETTSLATRLRRLRLAAGLTQEELAERAGLSTRGVQDLERGVRLSPRAETIRMLADALDLNAAERVELIAASRPELIESAPPAASPPALTSPPIPPTGLVGREREVAAACALLRQSVTRLLTLTGPGGVGKTRLALAIGAELAPDTSNGVVWVDLAPLRDPALVPDAVARSFGMTESGGKPVSEVLATTLAGHETLLIVDNCEHVLPSMAFFGELLAKTPELRVLATSRARLNVRGEREFPVSPLTVPELMPRGELPLAGLAGIPAVRLFVERAADVRPDFGLTDDNAAAVTAICRRLDGLPLALELAAAWVRLLPPEALLPRLERRLAFLAGGARDLNQRQQTMRAAIAWSNGLLAEPERLLFRRLSIFAGGFSLDAAAAVCGDDLDVQPLEGVAALLDQSLIQRVMNSEGDPRFRMLEIIREYGLEQLEATGDRDRIRHRHAQFFLAYAEAAQSRINQADGPSVLARLETEHDNMRAALAWAVEHDASIALRLVGALWRFWWLRGYLSEGRIWANAALATSGGTEVERARVLYVAGDLAQEQGDYAAAVPLLEAGLTAARGAGSREIEAQCLTGLGFIARNHGEYDRAFAFQNAALALHRKIGDRRAVACSLGNMGSIEQNRGQVDRAMALNVEALAEFRELGDQLHAADIAANLAILANQTGSHQEAGAFAEEALAIYREIGDRQAIATTSLSLATAKRGLGTIAAARETYKEALGLLIELDHRAGVASALRHLADIAVRQGEPHLAISYLDESLGILRETGDLPMVLSVIDVATVAAIEMSRWDPAAQLIGLAATIRGRIGVEPGPDSNVQRALNAAHDRLPESAAIAIAAFPALIATDDFVTATQDCLVRLT